MLNLTEDLYNQNYYQGQEFGFKSECRADHDRIIELLQAYAPKKKGARILEIGCGFGNLLKKIPFDNKVGVEVSETGVKRCLNFY